MSTNSTQDTVFSVLGHTHGWLREISVHCTRAIGQIDAGTMDFGNLSNGLMNQLRGFVNNTQDPAVDWGAAFTINMDDVALVQLNVTGYAAEVTLARTAVRDALQIASDLFPRNGANKVIYEEITPGGSTYDTPGDLTVLRAALVDVVDATY